MKKTLLITISLLAFISCNNNQKVAIETLQTAIEISENNYSSNDNYTEEIDSIIPLDTISKTEALKKASVKSRKIVNTEDLDYWDIEYFNKNGLLIKHEEYGTNNKYSDHDTTVTTRLYTFDAKKRLVKKIRKDKDRFIMKTIYTYKNNLLEVEENTTDDGPYDQTNYSYDENNRLIETIQKDLKNKNNDWKSIYTYTKTGLLKSKKQYSMQTDKVASIQQFEYNEFGLKTKMISETSLGSQQKEWQYNNFGQALNVYNNQYINIGQVRGTNKIKTSNYYNKKNLIRIQYLDKEIKGSSAQYYKSGAFEINYQYTFYK